MTDPTVLQPWMGGGLRPGVQLNGVYEIQSLIGHGGMGEVYRGFNIQTKDAVAIKMIRAEFASDTEIYELFRREAFVLHNLIHDAIVRYFVFTVDPALGRAYLAMEYVDGPSLTDRLKQGKLDLADVSVLRKRIASALKVAHDHGVIHRDVSPDNIILPGGDIRAAKVIDFGIARSLARPEASIIGGRFAGKYNYASPEQFGMNGGEVTLKSDIYSFGLVLAAALRGRPLDMSGSEVEAIAKRAAVPDLSEIDPSIRPLLERMLQPSPNNRPADMAEIGAWEPNQAGRRDGSGTPAAPGEARPRVGRLAIAAAAAIMLASVIGAAYVFRDDIGRMARPSPQIAAKDALAPQGAGNGAGAPPESAASAKPSASPPGPAPLSSVAPSLPPLTAAPTGSPAPSPGESAAARPSETAAPSPDSRPSASGAAPAASPSPIVTSDDLVAPLAAAKSRVDLPRAMVGEPYSFELPPFVGGGDAPPKIVADDMPGGLRLRDLGGGRAEVSGTPSAAGDAQISVTASNARGQAARMVASIEVAARPEPLIAPLGPRGREPPGVAAESPADDAASRARAFVASFSGGECFLIRPRGETPHAYQGVGRDIAPFQRFDEGYRAAVRADPDLNLAQIGPLQCPALDMIRAGESTLSEPRIELADSDIRPGQRLSGTVSNVGGRRVYVLLVDSDGTVVRLDARRRNGTDALEFSAPLGRTPGAAEYMQIVLAISSDKPIAALETLRSAPLRSIAARLANETRQASASVAANYFRFAN